MKYQENTIFRKLKDLKAVEFGETQHEITDSLLIISALYEFEDNKLVVQASRKKLQEGINLLKLISNTGMENSPRI